MENPSDGLTLELNNHDTKDSNHPALLKCKFVKETDDEFSVRPWKDPSTDDGYFEVKIGDQLETRDVNGTESNGTLNNLMKLLEHISLDSDDDFYTNVREQYFSDMGYKYFDPNEPLEESIEIAKLSGDNNIPEINNIEDYVNFSKDSKFLARSNGINSVRLKVYDPRDLEVVSNSPEIIHAQAFKEVPHQASTSNSLQVFSHQYWEPKLEGEYTVQSIAIDTTGNATPSQKVSTLSVTKGAENRPEVSLSYFADNLPIGSDINLRANVSDFTSTNSKGEIQFVGFLVNGRIYGPLDNQSPYFTTLRLNQAGRYEIFAFAGDDEGNINFSRRRNIRVYTDSPYDLSTERISSSKISVSSNRRFTEITGLSFPLVNDENRTTLPQEGTKIKFQFEVGDNEVTSDGLYTVMSIDSDGTLSIFENLTDDDSALISTASEVEILEAFKVGSQIYFPVTQKINQGTLESVQFFSNGESLETDFVAPYSTVFTPTIGGIYSLTAISTSYTGLQNILERKIFVEDKKPNTRMPYGSIDILPDLSGYSYSWGNVADDIVKPIVVGRGSTLVAKANFEDLDGYIEKLDIYLNGEIQPQNVKGSNSISFIPYSISDANIVELCAIAEDNDGNTVVAERTILVYDPAPFPKLNLDPPSVNNVNLLDGEISTFNVRTQGVLARNLRSASLQIEAQSPNGSLRNCMIVGNGMIIGYAQESGVGSGRFSFDWNVDADFASPEGKVEIRALMPSSKSSNDDTGTEFFFNINQSAALMGISPLYCESNSLQGKT